jgi:NAD(P)-dependent dehydrogenase (short-subunit alcohol dehydrogenase family)
MSARRALVTGSVRGLGLAMARGLAQARAEVVLNGRDEAALAYATNQLRDEGLDARHQAFDVTDRGATRAALDAIGPLDVASEWIAIVCSAEDPNQNRYTHSHIMTLSSTSRPQTRPYRLTVSVRVPSKRA